MKATAVLLSMLPAATALLLACGATAQNQPTAEIAPNVVTLRVDAVEFPPLLPGECRVIGRVEAVQRGTTFRSGQVIRLSVPCHRSGLTGSRLAPPGNPVVFPGPGAEELRRSKEGRAALDNDGRLIPSKTASVGDPEGVGYEILGGGGPELL